ncbi:hypothetical protein QRD02_10165 [Aequorivita sp. SDUM287046]|uniref:DUF4595 domain-containing protein n=1 Tax=Aequorivita aurantiaca TaxID=3053356 RepID=A0ABT8DIV7_9FLAO|nr:hypothetical protein [Aequorivita aurantiaca]MDN3724749.1 hypothetical protein [Aequorivita aurantiaca]
MKTTKLILSILIILGTMGCNKDDDSNPPEELEISPIPIAINFTTGAGESGSYEFEYNDINQITKIVKTFTAGITTEMYEYNVGNKLKKLTRITPTYTEEAVINYNAEGKIVNLDVGAYIITVTETPTGFETNIDGELNLYFSEENQIKEISNSSYACIFTSNTTIGGPFRNVNVDRVFYLLNLYELYIYSEDALVHISNYFLVPSIICIPVENENGLVGSNQIIFEPAEPSVTVNYSYQ